MTTPARLRAPAAALLLIDVQTANVPPGEAAARTVECAGRLAALAGALALPVVLTELAPERLGPTVPELRVLLAAAGRARPPIVRSAYSAFDEPGFAAALAGLDRRQLLLAGFEAAGAVLLTGLAAVQRGYDVHLVVEATGGRDRLETELALAQLRQAGGWPTSLRTVVRALVSETAGERFQAARRWLEEPE